MARKNKKIRWWEPKVEKEDYRFIKQALDNNFVNEGPLAEQFIKEITELLGVPYGVVTNSCTTAMSIALRAAGVKPGDEVIVPDITFIATANAVDQAGATAVLVDIDPETLTISPTAIERAITKKTRAIIPVHVTGRAADMTAILRIARARKLAIIEDAAEALTSRYKGRYLGTWGDAGCISFSANKTVSTGLGGIVVTKHKHLYEKLRELRDQGRPARGTGGDDIHHSIGYQLRMTDLQAGMGLGQLRHLKERTARMSRNYELYTKGLRGVGDIRVFSLQAGGIPQWTDITTARRDELEAFLRARDIDCRKYWFPLHTQQPYKRPDKNFPNSTRMSPLSLWLPSAFTATDADIRRVIREIRAFYAVQ